MLVITPQPQIWSVYDLTVFVYTGLLLTTFKINMQENLARKWKWNENLYVPNSYKKWFTLFVSWIPGVISLQMLILSEGN